MAKSGKDVGVLAAAVKGAAPVPPVAVTQNGATPAALEVMPRPHAVRFLGGDVAVVLDKIGTQLTAFSGTHRETVEALAAAGIDWKTLPEKWGQPRMMLPQEVGAGGPGKDGPWDGRAPRDSNGSFTVEPEAVGVSIPMLELVGPKGQTPYRAFEISIKGSRFSADPLAQEAIRLVQDAMSVTNAGVAGKSNPSAADAVLYVFHQLGAAWRASRKG